MYMCRCIIKRARKDAHMQMHTPLCAQHDKYIHAHAFTEHIVRYASAHPYQHACNLHARNENENDDQTVYDSRSGTREVKHARQPSRPGRSGDARLSLRYLRHSYGVELESSRSRTHACRTHSRAMYPARCRSFLRMKQRWVHRSCRIFW